jgi:hypothetical protein
MSKYYVYSTMGQDVTYSHYSKLDGEFTPVALRSVTIKGGAGIITKNLITPEGVVTEISEEEHNILKGGDGIPPNKIFEKQEKDGFVKIQNKNIKVDKAVKDLTPNDLSAQKTENDFKAKDGESYVHSVG